MRSKCPLLVSFNSVMLDKTQFAFPAALRGSRHYLLNQNVYVSMRQKILHHYPERLTLSSGYKQKGSLGLLLVMLKACSFVWQEHRRWSNWDDAYDSRDIKADVSHAACVQLHLNLLSGFVWQVASKKDAPKKNVYCTLPECWNQQRIRDSPTAISDLRLPMILSVCVCVCTGHWETWEEDFLQWLKKFSRGYSNSARSCFKLAWPWSVLLFYEPCKSRPYPDWNM